MSVKIGDARAALVKIAKEFDLDLKKVQNLVKDEIPLAPVFASKTARELAKEKGLKASKIKATGKNGKITVDDVRIAAGEEPKKKVENLFASTAGKKLAEEHGLTQDNFEESEKTGNPRKSGSITITIEDVKLKAGLISERKKKKEKKVKEDE